MKRALVLASLLAPAIAFAQAPDVRAHGDLSLSFDYRNKFDRTSARLYDPLGRPSVVGLNLTLEAGYNVLISERLQRLPGDADGDIFDETYIEDPGIWRIGKQYLPFGAGHLLHESATAARIDSNLIAESLPVVLALVSGGQGRQDGVVIRVGGSVGVSFATGRHFGISGTSLGVVRPPEFAPGRNGGWKHILGADAQRQYGKLALSVEAASFAGGAERDKSVFTASGNFLADEYHALGVELSTIPGRATDFLRVFGRVHAARSVDLEPMVRWRDGAFYDAAVTVRVRF